MRTVRWQHPGHRAGNAFDSEQLERVPRADFSVSEILTGIAELRQTLLEVVWQHGFG
jgi:hypothetical protein